MQAKINYLLLKMRLKRIRAIIIIQNQGLISRFLMGSYPILPKALVSTFSSQPYIFIKKVFIFSAVKKFFIASIFFKFYRLFVYL